MKTLLNKAQHRAAKGRVQSPTSPAGVGNVNRLKMGIHLLWILKSKEETKPAQSLHY